MVLGNGGMAPPENATVALLPSLAGWGLGVRCLRGGDWLPLAADFRPYDVLGRGGTAEDVWTGF